MLKVVGVFGSTSGLTSFCPKRVKFQLADMPCSTQGSAYASVAKWMPQRAAAGRTGVGEHHAVGGLTGGARLWTISEEVPWMHPSAEASLAMREVILWTTRKKGRHGCVNKT